jgi:hypothetical protein
MYECPRCHREMKQKGDLKKHFNRKKVCEIVYENFDIEKCFKLLEDGKLKIANNKKNHICEYCNKLFDRNSRLVTHSYICDKKILYDTIKKLEEKVNNLENKQITVNNNSNNTNNIYININSYKNTDYTLIKDDIDDCIENGEINIGKLMEKVHFNDKFPQNRNVYISNSKTRRVMKYDGKKFIEDGMGNTGLEKVFNEKLADIEEHQELTDDIKLAAEESWMQYNDKDTIQRKEVLEAIYKPLYNKRDIVNKNLIEI